MNLRHVVPWWARIAAKVVLSHSGLNYRSWKKCGLFVHGAMDTPSYATKVVLSHLTRVGWPDLLGKTVLELGPGDSLASAVICRALGAEVCYLSDTGPWATMDVTVYRSLQSHLEGQGLHPPDLSGCTTIENVLSVCRAVYLTDGLTGLGRIPAASVDLVFSQAVLEHVRAGEFLATQQEIRRVLRSGGLASHQVDLKDHLGGALNNLRLSDGLWEADWMARSGFYTNRLRYAEVLRDIAAAGMAVEVADVQRWQVLPTPRARMLPRFRALADDELLVTQFDVVSRPVPEGNPAHD